MDETAATAEPDETAATAEPDETAEVPRSVCVVGLGHVGLSTAAMLADSGLAVHGFDVDEARLAAVRSGHAPADMGELEALVAKAVGAGRLTAGRAPAAADAFIIAVPTPTMHGNRPDLGYVRSAVDQIARVLDKGNLVVLESTTPVSTTEQVCDWLAAARPDLSMPHSIGEASDIRVAYCPERANPGRMLEELVHNDRIIGGVTPACAAEAAALYRSFAGGTCHLTTARTAELTKLTENAFRDVNIAFANEMSMVCQALGVDPWEMIGLANQHPRVDILQPGPGVGGHCIPIDPWFIADSEQRLTPLIRAARHVNDAKQSWVASEIISRCEGIESPVVACLGLSYKADVADLRGSPAVAVVRQLQKSLPGRFLVVEPHLSTLPAELAEHPKTELTNAATAIGAADMVALLTDHTEFRSVNRQQLTRKLLVDPRGFWARTTQASQT